MTTMDQAREAFSERLFEATVATMDVFSVYLGDRLGLYRLLSERGPLTAAELADAAGMDARYAREWLEQQAATAILDVDDEALPEGDRRFSVPAGHAEPLTDPESPFAVAAMCRSMAAIAGTLPALVDVYRTGEGYAFSGADAIGAQGDFNRPWLVRSFATEYLPTVPDVHARLQEGARVADVACGVGWAAISIARAYPASTVDGFDLDEPSIVLARANAEAAGVSDRVTFRARDAGDPSPSSPYDLAVIVEAVHDLSKPVEVLTTVRRMLGPRGTLIVADERVADAFHAPADLIERIFYGYSILSCLPAGMLDKPSAGTGTVMRRGTLERYAAEAGFAEVSVLPIEHDFLRFYRLDP